MPTLKMDGTEFTLKVKQYAKPEIIDTNNGRREVVQVKNVT